MPRSWSALSERLRNGSQPTIRTLAFSLAVTFGDPAALVKMRELLAKEGPRAVAGQMLPKLLSDAAAPEVVGKTRAKSESPLRGHDLWRSATRRKVDGNASPARGEAR